MKHMTMLVATSMFVTLSCAHEANDQDVDKGKILIETDSTYAGEPKVCPETGTCNEAYEQERLACWHLGEKSLCGSNSPAGCGLPGYQDECAGESSTCVVDFRSICPECDVDRACVDAASCGNEIPMEQCPYLGRPRPCPATGKCNWTYEADFLACWQLGDEALCRTALPTGCGIPGDPDACADASMTCVVDFKKICPECDKDRACTDAAFCGAAIPMEQCPFL